MILAQTKPLVVISSILIHQLLWSALSGESCSGSIPQLFMSCFLATSTEVAESTRPSAVMYWCDKKKLLVQFLLISTDHSWTSAQSHAGNDSFIQLHHVLAWLQAHQG